MVIIDPHNWIIIRACVSRQNFSTAYGRVLNKQCYSIIGWSEYFFSKELTSELLGEKVLRQNCIDPES